MNLISWSDGELPVRAGGVEGQTLESLVGGSGGGSLYTRTAMLDPGNLSGMDNLLGVSPENNSIPTMVVPPVDVAFFCRWIYGLALDQFYTTLPFSANKG